MALREVEISVLRDTFAYDPESGALLRDGRTAGCVTIHGYREVRVSGVRIYAHRVAWALHYGVWPSGMIDHANGNRLDNRLCNLREATPAQNGWNRRVSRNTSSGFKGVCYHTGQRRWRAKIHHNGVEKHLGSFLTKDEACGAYRAAAIEYHGEFARFE